MSKYAMVDFYGESRTDVMNSTIAVGTEILERIFDMLTGSYGVEITERNISGMCLL